MRKDKMTDLEKFDDFLKSVDLQKYREMYRPVKIVEMDLPKNIQALDSLYDTYWHDRSFLSYDDYYDKYLARHKTDIEDFRVKTTMCQDCFYRGLPARIYRTWASLITQIHAGYVAESVFGPGTVEMSTELDHQGADFRVTYKGVVINYQVKKETQSREVRRNKSHGDKLDGVFIDILYMVPTDDVFANPRTLKGEYRKPYTDFMNNTKIKRFDNGFVVFTPEIFETHKRLIDEGKELA